MPIAQALPGCHGVDDQPLDSESRGERCFDVRGLAARPGTSCAQYPRWFGPRGREVEGLGEACAVPGDEFLVAGDARGFGYSYCQRGPRYQPTKEIRVPVLTGVTS